MFNKIYVKIKENIKVIIINITIMLGIIVISLVPIPNSYITIGGGITPITDKIIIGNNGLNDNYYMAYVTQLKATIPYYLFSIFNKDWDYYKVESSKNEDKFSSILLNNSIDNAILNAYKLANKKVDITKVVNEVIYIHPQAKTNIKVADIILKIEGESVTDKNSYINIVKQKEVGTKLNVTVKSGNEYKEKYIEVIEIDNLKMTGISFVTNYEYLTDPDIDIKFSAKESGPSAGLMLGLSIYDKLTESNFSKNNKIVGTGMIDISGNVLPIGGVSYKFKAAVKEKADIFIVPYIENYEEVLKIKEENNYNIDIIAVKTIEEAIKKLQNVIYRQ